jgi:type I restriction enzyme M protein
MKDNKKEQERAELHRMIWGIANDLCGSVDGWDFKQNVLGMLSYRYISENLTNYINAGEHIAAIKDFDYANLAGKEAKKAIQDIINIKGYFIFLGELFENVRKKAAKDENLNETLERVFNNIERSAKGAESELSFAGLFADFDVSSNKFGATVAKYNEHLIKLMNSVSEMKPDGYRDNIIDAFGDAYEYLMGMYQSSAGKYGGEFYNPQEVSELLTRITIVDKSKVNKVYNPACGLGSLLLNFAKIFGQKNVRKGFYWQKVNLTTYNLCRINIFLHDINYDKFDIAHEDTFKDPQHLDYEPFEAVVSNPPYSIKWEGDGNQLLINDLRFFPAGILAPKSKADLAHHAQLILAGN